MEKENRKNTVTTPPQNFDELIANLNFIVGKSLTELAEYARVPVPIDTLHGKGFTGELIEKCLGASAENQSIPDFPELGLELKSIPVDDNLCPLESTFLCYAPLTGIRHYTEPLETWILMKELFLDISSSPLLKTNLKPSKRTSMNFTSW